ncbi:MAG TPA: nitrite reductase large subunit NirB, partial [Planctomycetota bacterium]|nr:nitrite reductase large subunit NirB [Planctomycetota bacterium]
MIQAARKRLVVIGNGMAGARVVEEVLQRAPERFDITMFGAEPYGNYNRILLSNVLNRTQSAAEIFINPLEWYQRNKVTLHAGVKAVKIDRARRIVLGKTLDRRAVAYAVGESGAPALPPVEAPYDHVIIATGSRPFVPPMEGFGGPGTFLFRTIDDCERIADYAKDCKKAAVIGGGLLGLEAARGLLTHGVEVTVLEAAPQLMIAQLDADAGQILKTTMEGMGVRVLCEKITTHIVSENGRVTHLQLKDGSRLDADMVVVSAGIRPITEVASASGLTVDKAIVTDDQMRTSDPDVFSLGECVQHRGKIYGLVDPIWEQAAVLADVLTGKNPQAAYLGSRLGTKLKVMGVELASMGETKPAGPDDEVILYREPRRGIYKKVILRDNKVVGAILLGETETASTLMQFFRGGSKAPENRPDLLFAPTEGASMLQVLDMPDALQICNCNGVTKKQIVDAIRGGCGSVAKVGACTKAGTGCQSCKPVVSQLIDAYRDASAADASESYYVPGVPLEKSQLVDAIRAKGLKSVSDVFAQLAGGKEDAGSKVGLASLLKSLWPDEYVDERDARFINDRVHANIQKDGTFSVVPRIYGGVTTPAELRRIAEVAEKYQVPMVKITGGQRIDLLGVKKGDLPGMWQELGMPSGHAYTKSFRTCKSCVGTDFCRYGVGDSIALAQKIERRFQGIESPHKMKLATAGCPRNCSEAYVKDLGAVAIEGGLWEIYLGGAAGGSVRKGDLLCTVKTHDEVLKYMGRFMQYYREHGKYLERSYHFVERVGIETLKRILIDDSLGLCARLDADIQKAVDAYKDPWKEADLPAYPAQFSGPELAAVLEVAE